MANRGDKTNGARGFHPGGMALQTGKGGTVPGHGKGDKVPAKYEPGEVVVSNAMLDASPGLREHLSSLHEKALAGEGMTPKQANTQAMKGGKLHAARGYLEDDPASRMAQTPAQAAINSGRVAINNDTAARGFDAARAQTLQRIDAPGRVAGSTFTPSPDPRVMTQGPSGVTAPGQPYAAPATPGTALQVAPARGMAPADAGRSFTPPSNFAPDPKTIYQGPNTSAPSNLATSPTTGRGLALTGDAGRGAQGMATPTNPSFANGISPEAAGYQAARTGPFQTGTATPPATAPAGWKATAGNVAKNLGFGALGFGAARVMDGMENNAPKMPADTRANVNAIPTGGNAPAPAAGPATGWWDTNTGRNVSNTLNAVSPMLGPLANTVRAGSNVSRVANTGAALIAGMAAGANPSPAMPSQAAAEVPQPMPATQTDVQRGGAISAMAAVNPNQINVTKQPNGTMSFSGGPNIGKDGGEISYNAGTSGFKPSGAGVTSMPGANMASGSPSMDTALSAARFAAADRGDFSAVRDSYQNGGGTFNGETRADTQMQDLMRQAQGSTGRKQAGFISMMGSLAEQSRAKSANDIAGKKMGLDQQEFGLKKTAADFTTHAAQQLEAAHTAYNNAKTPEEKQAAAEAIRVLGGKDKAPQWGGVAIAGSKNQDGSTNDGDLALYNHQTGEIKRASQAGVQATATGPMTKAAYDKLPKGAQFTAPDGSTRIKG